MDKETTKKIVAIISIILLFLNLLFVALRIYSHFIFWLIIGIIAVVSISIMRLVR